MPYRVDELVEDTFSLVGIRFKVAPSMFPLKTQLTCIR